MKEEVKEGYKNTEIGLIPKEWEIKKLEEICNILDSERIPLNAKQRENMKGTIPYYGANGIVDYINDYLFDEELILLAEDGGNFEDYKNKPICLLVNGKSWVNNHAHVLQPKIGECIKWIFYSLEHKDITSFVQGGTRSKLNQKDLRRIKIPYPKRMEEQQKIVYIFSTIDKLIEQTEKLIEKVNELKKGLAQRLLIKGIGHIEFKKTEMGEIPKNWEIKKLGDICDFKQGFQIPRNEQINKDEQGYIRYLYITDFFSDKNKLYVKNDKKFYYIREEDIVIANTGNTCGKAFRGKSGVLSNNMFKIFINESKLFNDYLWQYLNSQYYWRQLNSFFNSAGQPHVGHKNMSLLKIALPNSIEEQKKIASILIEIDNKIEEYEIKKEKLQILKKGFIQNLLTGNIRIKI